MKEPKDDSFTVSPRSKQSVISLSTSSTSAADSACDSQGAKNQRGRLIAQRRD
jgi:hypothetical protein